MYFFSSKRLSVNKLFNTLQFYLPCSDSCLKPLVFHVRRTGIAIRWPSRRSRPRSIFENINGGTVDKIVFFWYPNFRPCSPAVRITQPQQQPICLSCARTHCDFLYPSNNSRTSGQGATFNVLGGNVFSFICITGPSQTAPSPSTHVKSSSATAASAVRASCRDVKAGKRGNDVMEAKELIRKRCEVSPGFSLGLKIVLRPGKLLVVENTNWRVLSPCSSLSCLQLNVIWLNSRRSLSSEIPFTGLI